MKLVIRLFHSRLKKIKCMVMTSEFVFCFEKHNKFITSVMEHLH